MRPSVNQELSEIGCSFMLLSAGNSVFNTIQSQKIVYRQSKLHHIWFTKKCFGF